MAMARAMPQGPRAWRHPPKGTRDIIVRMSWEAWAVLVVVVAVFTALWNNWAAPDVVLMGGAVILTLLGLAGSTLPSPKDLAAGFGNEGVLTVGVLFIAAAGLTETGGLQLVTDRLLGLPRSTLEGQARLML